MDLFILQNITVILLTAVIILLIFNKLKLPSMIGLFLTGIVLGQFLHSAETINTISELGVIFLLFIIGLEFSMEKFSSIKHYAIIGGILQVLLTTLIVTILSVLVGFPINQGIFMGFLVSFSSTAIVMKLIQERQMNNSIQGKVVLGILIFQDIAVILVLLLTPLLGGSKIDITTLPQTLITVVTLVVVLAVCSKWIIPKVLHIASYTKNRDLFILLTLVICLGTTYATSLAGISPELGAFIAGLMISKTEFSHQTLGYVEPFQDVFMSLFLISIGLMLDVNYFISNIVLIIALAIVVLVVKILATGTTIAVLKLPMRIIVIVSVLLSQIGEFSFILAAEGLKYNIITNDLFTLFLATTVITMSLTPFLQKLTPKIIEKIGNRGMRLPENDEALPTQIDENDENISDHVILAGFGVNGRNIAKACKNQNIPYIAIDLNPIIVKRQKALGEHIIYGDASKENILEEVNISKAKMIIIATTDYRGSLKATDTARRLNPNIHIEVRTKYIKNVDELYEAGADEVIPEEFETGLVIFSRIMDFYNKDPDEITETINELRSDHYNELRLISTDDLSLDLNEADTDLIADSIYIDENKSLDDYDFNKYDLTITSIIRGNDTITEFSDKFQLLENDIVLFTGNESDINRFMNVYKY